jgi:kynureninase
MSVDHKVINELLALAKKQNKEDVLLHVKEAFLIPENVIYVDGNSLGPLTKKAKERALAVVEQQWGNSLIASWNRHDWINLPQLVGNKIAPLLGVGENTVICCDSISVNLFKLLSAAMLMQGSNNTVSEQPHRHLILSQDDNFPTDLYVVQGLQNLMTSSPKGCELLSVKSNEIEQSIEQYGDQIAVLMLTHVNFRNGDIHDMKHLTALAHSKGILVLWDLAHSAGVLPLALEDCDVDFAVGCTYKYLNGGPGSPGFAYVAKQHLPALRQPLSGWMGHKQPFAFEHDYQKATGIEQLLCGTPSIISMSVLDAALDIFENINTTQIRNKSIALNTFFQFCFNTLINDLQQNANDVEALVLACNSDAAKRGSQISYAHPNAYAICQALIDQGVIADFRAPDTLRIGFSPLFLSYTDMFKAAQILANILVNETYLAPEFNVKNTVT